MFLKILNPLPVFGVFRLVMAGTIAYSDKAPATCVTFDVVADPAPKHSASRGPSATQLVVSTACIVAAVID